MTKSTFTAEQVTAALAVRDQIIKGDIDDLKNVYMAGEIVMWHTETASLQSENESLRAALKERQDALNDLVALKDMKDDIDELEYNDPNAYYLKKEEYQTRKPLAWEQARKLSNPK